MNRYQVKFNFWAAQQQTLQTVKLRSQNWKRWNCPYTDADKTEESTRFEGQAMASAFPNQDMREGSARQPYGLQIVRIKMGLPYLDFRTDGLQKMLHNVVFYPV